MKFEKDFFTHNIERWERILKLYKDKHNIHVLEIGCFEGRSTLWFIKNILTDKKSSISVVDTFEGSIEHKDLNVNTYNLLTRFKNNISQYKSKVNIYKNSSSKVLRSFKLIEKFDIIYIDGSHIAKDVLEDAVLSWRLLKVGGILIFDDYEWDMYSQRELCPRLAIDSFLEIYKNQYEIIEKNYQVYIKKITNEVKIPEVSHSEMNGRLIERITKLESDLNKIQNSKTYKIWQFFNKIKRKIFFYN